MIILLGFESLFCYLTSFIVKVRAESSVTFCCLLSVVFLMNFILFLLIRTGLLGECWSRTTTFLLLLLALGV